MENKTKKIIYPEKDTDGVGTDVKFTISVIAKSKLTEEKVAEYVGEMKKKYPDKNIHQLMMMFHQAFLHDFCGEHFNLHR